jgi:hypothetical protein
LPRVDTRLERDGQTSADFEEEAGGVARFVEIGSCSLLPGAAQVYAVFGGKPRSLEMRAERVGQAPFRDGGQAIVSRY